MNALEKVLTRIECECFALEKAGQGCNGCCTPAQARSEYAALLAFRATLLVVAEQSGIAWIRDLSEALDGAVREGLPDEKGGRR